MTFHPHRSLGRIPASVINRVSKFSQRDSIEAAPDTLTLVKREVNTLDLLQVSDVATYNARIAAITDTRTKQLFFSGNFDRLRYRYAAYGMEEAVLKSLLAALVKVNYGKATAWLRLAATTSVSGKWTNIIDVLNPANPVVQSTAGRQPSVVTSVNGLPLISWSGANVMPWTITAANNSTAAWGFCCWIKPTANIVTRQRLFKADFPGASSKVQIDIASSRVEINWSKDGTNGRNQLTVGGVIANTQQFFRVQFDGSASAVDANTMKVFINEIEQTGSTYGAIGTGPVMTALNSTSGFYTIGAREDQDAPTAPLLNGFLTGPNYQVFNSVLTAQEGLNVMNFEVPT